jgi:hypothetical protein
MKWQGESGFYYKKLDSTKCIWIKVSNNKKIKAYYYFVEIISDNNYEQSIYVKYDLVK